MLETVHIVGCGTVGSNLALAIAKRKTTKCLYLTDPDIVSYENQYLYPFSERCSGLHKTEVVRNLVQQIDSSVVIYTRKTKVEFYPTIDKCLTIDCRDRKDNHISSSIRLSLDNHILIIDTTEKVNDDEVSRYYLEQELTYVDLAISIIMHYLTTKLIFCNKLKLMYDLDVLMEQYDVVEGTLHGSS